MERNDTFNKLMNRPGYMFRRCRQVAGGIFDRACKDIGLTSGQYDVLFVLANEGSVDQDNLAKYLGLDRSTIGVLANNLERKGLVSRKVKPSDHRKRILTLTETGQIAFVSAEPLAEHAKSRVLAPLSKKEREILFELMSRIVLQTATDVS